MYVADGFGQRHEVVSAAQRLGHGVRDTILGQRPRVAEDAVIALVAQRRGYLLGRGVYALPAAAGGAAQRLFYHLQLGMYYGQLPAEERRTSEDDVFAPDLDALLDPFYAVEPSQFGRARGVGYIGREALPPFLSGVCHTRHAAAELYQRRGHRLVYGVDGVDLRAVDIAEGVVAQQVTHGEDAELLFEEPGTCLAYARDILDAALENICHDTKI